MKQKLSVLSVLSAIILAGCGKPPAETDVAQQKTADGRVAYVSDQEQYVQSLHAEVAIEDPDSLLEELNEAMGDNSENAELVRLKSQEASPASQTATDRERDTSAAATAVTPENAAEVAGD